MFIKIEALDRIRRLFEKPPRRIDAEMDFEFGQARRAQRTQSNKERSQSEAEGPAAQAND